MLYKPVGTLIYHWFQASVNVVTVVYYGVPTILYFVELSLVGILKFNFF